MIELNDTEFMGRQVFIREDREEGGGGGRQQNQNQNQVQGQGQMFERPRHFVPQMQQMQQQGMQSQYHDQQQQQHQQQHQQQQQQQQHFQQQQQHHHQHQQHHQQFENKMTTGGSGEGRKIYVGNLSWEVSKLIIGYQYTLFTVLLMIVKREKER